MPLIDVTSILSDPDIAGERFTVLRRLETINDFGESVVTTQQLPAIGSITPTGDNSLIRQEALDTQSDSIKVLTTYPLNGPSKSATGYVFKPDIVVWKGETFIVRVVNDWSQYGAGFFEAECVSTDLPGSASTGPDAATASMDFSIPSNSQYIEER